MRDTAHVASTAIVDGVSAPIPTYDLTQAQFASHVVDFQHVDVADQHGNALQQLTVAQQSRLDRYDPRGGIPFLDIGDAYVQVSSGYAPSLLQGLSFTQVKQDMADPTSTVGQTIHQEGTRITALICQLESLASQAVCQDPAVKADLAQVNGEERSTCTSNNTRNRCPGRSRSCIVSDRT